MRELYRRTIYIPGVIDGTDASMLIVAPSAIRGRRTIAAPLILPSTAALIGMKPHEGCTRRRSNGSTNVSDGLCVIRQYTIASTAAVSDAGTHRHHPPGRSATTSVNTPSVRSAAPPFGMR